MPSLPPHVLRTALRDAGIPDAFSVVPVAQLVPESLAREIDELIAVFERVTTRPSWQRAVSADGPAWANPPHTEVCFFSAWDFHVPHDDPDGWQLIEVNDNGSGFLFASIINRSFYELANLATDRSIDAPLARAAFEDRIAAMVDREARNWDQTRRSRRSPEKVGNVVSDPLLVLDDAESLSRGHFRAELDLLASLLAAHGWQTTIGAPEELSVGDSMLRHRGRDVSFVINRSTEFLWQGDAFQPLRESFAAGRVYVAPNPFTYLTRSDKRLFELLSHGDRDDELGISSAERAVLSRRVPETLVLRDDNVDELARRKHELFFKPARGYASHGTIAGESVGRSRLSRLLRSGEPYVAQRFVAQGELVMPGAEAAPLHTDLRVWAYRGDRYLVSGRASTREDRRELRAGGWIPTFVAEVERGPSGP